MLRYTQGAREIADYYAAQPDVDIAPMIERAREIIKTDLPVCAQKAAVHEWIARECAVHIFPHYPYFYEVACGRSRCDWGTYSPIAIFLREQRAPLWLEPYAREIQKYKEAGLMHGWSPVGYDHHCPGYDWILEIGLTGLIDRAKARIERTADADERVYLESVVRSNEAAIALANRFADEAERLMALPQDEAARDNLARIAHSARHVPAYPARTFYEAVACILFIREVYGSLESYGMSTFGHIDRMLHRYYEADLRAGRIAPEEARALIDALLAFTDAKFDIGDAHYRETSTTIVIGGCDRSGAPVFNAVTRMVVNACMENRYVGTKIIARTSSAHSPEYFELLGEFVASKANVLVMPNDDVLIKANLRWGKAVEDARLYVGGGCHEVVLAGTEVNTRADTWINLPGLLMRTLIPGSDVPELTDAAQAGDFEALYSAVMANVRRFHDLIAGIKAKYERYWPIYDAAPLYSASIADCIDSARDITAGGARYNYLSLSMVGAATFVDSLIALKAIVYDEGRRTLPEFIALLENDFEGDEPLRLYIQNRLPKFGMGDREADRFSARVMGDLSDMAGQPNARGGSATPAFYPHDLFMLLGNQTMATPDGRRAGAHLSRGFSPSEFIKVDSVTDIVHSLKSLDMAQFPESIATELTLPAAIGTPYGAGAVAALIRSFVEAGGATLQINVIDREELIRAKQNPDEYPNLIVRVCGYSQAFNSLTDEKKDEMIGRALRAM